MYVRVCVASMVSGLDDGAKFFWQQYLMSLEGNVAREGGGGSESTKEAYQLLE